MDRVKQNNGELECHHILPRSLGGLNEHENLVLLTPREHYIAHWLLYKMHIGKERAKMAYAFFMMSRNNPSQRRDISSRQYERAKQAMSVSCSGENHPGFGKQLWSDEQKAAISKRQTGANNSMYGKEPWNKGKKLPPLSLARRMAISEFHTGRKHTDKTKEKISNTHKGKAKSDEHKERLSESLRGNVRTKESIEKTAEALRGRTHNVVKCPYCEKHGGHSAMQRWHFNNCKEYKNDNS